MKKVLILAYYYPPCGGAGVQRTIKFAKYLEKFGYKPVVVGGTGRDSYFQQDEELAKEVSKVTKYNIEFNKLEKTLDRFFHSPLGRWTRSTLTTWLNKASAVVDLAIKNEKPDILFVTTSPFPAAKVIQKAAIKHGIPWVLDMRDPWALDPISSYPTKYHYHFELQAMKKACFNANAIIMNTNGALQAAKNAFPLIDPNKFYCITNGWDKDDFEDIKCEKNNSSTTMIIAHSGEFHTKLAKKIIQKTLLAKARYSLYQINLLSRTPYYLYSAYRKLLNEKLLLPGSINFVFAGKASQADIDLTKEFEFENEVRFLGYLNHRKSIKLIKGADVLFLPLHELVGEHDPLIVPGKTYEYIAAKKPILACIPNGDAYEIINQTGLGYICEPSDISQIANMLLMLYNMHNCKENIVNHNDKYIQKYERVRLAKSLAEIFSAIL